MQLHIVYFKTCMLMRLLRYSDDKGDGDLPKSAELKRRLSPEARRQHLLECATMAYANLGVERAGHGDVAKLAGMSTPTVFNYFPTRKALTEAVFVSIDNDVCEIFEKTEGHLGLSSRQKLFLLAMSFNKMLETRVDTTKVLLNWSVSFGPDVRPAYLSFQGQMITRLGEVIGDTSQNKTDSRILYGAALTYSTLKLDDTPEETLAEYIMRVIDMVMPSK